MNTPRDRILATATRLFHEHGIRAVGMSRIKAEAGVAQMTPYRQFGGKQQLVVAVLEQEGSRWRHALQDRLDHCGDDPAARFDGFWTAIEELRASAEPYGSLITRAAAELRGEPGHPAHAVIAAHHQAVRQVLEDLCKLLGAHDPIEVAARLQLVLDGALEAVEVGGRPSAADARAVADAVLSSSMQSMLGDR